MFPETRDFSHGVVHPFAKYDHQKRKTTGKLEASLSMDDPEEQAWWNEYLVNCQYDQVGNGLL